MALCHLCREDKKLIKAHVVPRWAFIYLYPEQSVGKESLRLIGINKRQLKRPVGLYDSEIICKECDNFLGKFDKYGKDKLLDSNIERRSEEAYIIKNVDFEKLRIFILSVIWRASISNREEFKNVSLGPFEEKLRQILSKIKSGIVPDIESYSFVIGKYVEGELPSRVVNKNIQLPHSIKIDGINIIVLYLPRGLKIFFKVDSREFTTYLNLISNYQQEGLIVPILGNYSESDEFKSLLKVYVNNKNNSSIL